MTAHVILTCDCGNCPEHLLGHSTQGTRDKAFGAGWDVDTIDGSTVDYAPGHTPKRVAA